MNAVGAVVGVVLALLGLTACGGGSGDYSETDVIQAFAAQGIALDELIRPGPEENPLEVILAPTSGDSDELNVNLFTGTSELDDYVTRAFGRPFDGCQVVEGVMGCKQRNILVSLDLKSQRFKVQTVKRALTELS